MAHAWASAMHTRFTRSGVAYAVRSTAKAQPTSPTVLFAHGTGLAGEDQWRFVTHSYPKFVEWVLERWLEGHAHPMDDDRKVHWRDIDDREVMEEYIEEMGGIDKI